VPKRKEISYCGVGKARTHDFCNQALEKRKIKDKDD
jgi:hypothetical protein